MVKVSQPEKLFLRFKFICGLLNISMHLKRPTECHFLQVGGKWSQKSRYSSVPTDDGAMLTVVIDHTGTQSVPGKPANCTTFAFLFISTIQVLSDSFSDEFRTANHCN